MKIKEVTNDHILFDNGFKITYDHEQDCCEYNYADFNQIEPSAMACDFKDELLFESVDESGFRFGSLGTPMFFIPCYSMQNGYYTTDIDIYFNDDLVVSLLCEELFD